MKMEAEDMKSPFEAIKQSDEAGKEWWAFIDIAELRAERQLLIVDEGLGGAIGQIPFHQRP